MDLQKTKKQLFNGIIVTRGVSSEAVRAFAFEAKRLGLILS